jgi:hypothetical protein
VILEARRKSRAIGSEPPELWMLSMKNCAAWALGIVLAAWECAVVEMLGHKKPHGGSMKKKLINGTTHNQIAGRSPGSNHNQTVRRSPGSNHNQTVRRSPGSNHNQSVRRSPGSNHNQTVRRSPGSNHNQTVRRSPGSNHNQTVRRSPGSNHNQTLQGWFDSQSGLR